MLQRASAGLIAILVLAGCAEPGIAEPTPQPVLLAGRWISFMVKNAGEQDHHLAVVDDRDLTRIVGIVHRDGSRRHDAAGSRLRAR